MRSEVGARRLRVAIDISSAVDPRPSGVERYIRGLVDGLGAEPEIALTLLCRSSRWRQGDPPALFPDQKVTRWLDWARPTGFDVLHAPDLRLPRRPPRSVVVTVHDLSALDRGDHATASFIARKQRFLRRIARCATRVITHTGAVRRALVERLELLPERVVDVPLWPALPASAEAPIGDGSELLVVGGPSRRKRSERIAPFLARLQSVTGLGPRVAWCGSADSECAAAFFASLPEEVRDRIRWLGHIDDGTLDRRMRGAAALVQLSDTEGFGIPLVEAAMRHCPIVARRSETAEEVLPADGAFWCGGPDEDAQLRAFADPSERVRRAGRAAERATALSRTRTIAETLAVYRDAISARAATASVG